MGHGKQNGVDAQGKQNGVDANRNILYDSKDKCEETCNHSDKYLNDDLLPVPKLNITISSIIVFILSFLCFWVTQYGGFFFDDTTAIISNKDIRSDTPLLNILRNDFWGTRLQSSTSHKSYRPLTVLTYRWNYMIGGLQPRGFHVANICLYGLCTVFLLHVFSILIGGVQFDDYGKRVFTAPKASLLCACLFAVHPVHTESVAAVVGRADLICMIFYSISFLSYAKFSFKHSSLPLTSCCGDLITSLLSAAAAMFAKEQGITVLGICITFDVIMVAQVTPFNIQQWIKRKDVVWKVNMRCFLQRFVIVTVSAVLLLFVRLSMMGYQPKFQYGDNPASFQNSIFIRFLNYNYLYSLNIWLLLNPWWLCFDWAMGCIPVITSYTDIRLLAPLVMLVLLTVLILKLVTSLDTYISRCFTMSLAFLIIPFLPAMNIFFRVGFVIAERNLYISSVGFIMMIVIGFIVLSTTRNGRHFTRISSIMLLLIFTARSIHRAYDWLDEIQLFTSGIHVCPLNAKVHYNIGKSNQDAGNIDIAVSAYLEAIRLWPNYDQPMNNLGNIYKDRMMLKDAEYYLERAVNITPTFHTAWMNLGNVKADLKKKEEAITCFNQAVTHKTVYPDAYYNWGYLHLVNEEHNLALEKFDMAIQQKSDHEQAWRNKIILLGNIGKTEELLKAGSQASKTFPSDDNIHQTIGNSLGIVGQLKDAELFTKKALQLNPSNAEAASVLGVIYHRLHRYEEAKKYYKIALQANPDNESTKSNYAKLKNIERT